MYFKFFTLFIFLISSNAALLAQLQKEIRSKKDSLVLTKPAQPSMEETAKWLNDKYNSLRVTNPPSKYEYFINQQFTISDRYLKIKNITLFNIEAGQLTVYEIVADLATVSDVSFSYTGNPYCDCGGSFRLWSNYAANEIVTTETQKYFARDNKQDEDEIETKTEKSHSIYFPTLKPEEDSINERFLKALKHYIELCKQKYPPKKEIF